MNGKELQLVKKRNSKGLDDMLRSLLPSGIQGCLIPLLDVLVECLGIRGEGAKFHGLILVRFTQRSPRLVATVGPDIVIVSVKRSS